MNHFKIIEYEQMVNSTVNSFSIIYLIIDKLSTSGVFLPFNKRIKLFTTQFITHAPLDQFEDISAWNVLEKYLQRNERYFFAEYFSHCKHHL